MAKPHDVVGKSEKLPLLPQPVVMLESPSAHFMRQLDQIAWVAMWMFVSGAMIISCKWVLTSGGFPYPLLLTSIHMASCFVIFGSIRLFAPRRMKLALMPDAETTIPWGAYVQNVLSISLFFALSLGSGQIAYIYASVPFLQMIKPINCIIASLVAFLLGVEVPTMSHMIIVTIIALGVFIATDSADKFSLAGCLLQIMSAACSGIQLALTQRFTTGAFKVDPVSTVYLFSGPASVLLGFATLATERHLDLSHLRAPWVLMHNIALALILNVLVAVVIKKTSAVIYTLMAIIKDIGVVGASSIIFMTPVTTLSALGYSLALVGLCVFKGYKDNLDIFKKHGFFIGMYTVMGSMVRDRKS
jgi:hypothetical protein